MTQIKKQQKKECPLKGRMGQCSSEAECFHNKKPNHKKAFDDMFKVDLSFLNVIKKESI